MLGLSAFSAGEIVQQITQTFSQFLSGTGASIVDFFKTLFVDAEGNMTVFAVVSLAFLGLSLAVGVASMIFRLVKRR